MNIQPKTEKYRESLYDELLLDIIEKRVYDKDHNLVGTIRVKESVLEMEDEDFWSSLWLLIQVVNRIIKWVLIFTTLCR